MSNGYTSSLRKGNELWKSRAALVGTCVCLGFALGWFVAGVTSHAAPDPVALKVQGADTAGNAILSQAQPAGASGTTQTQITSSATGANATQTATLAGVAAKTTYITGFQCTADGSTAGGQVTVTITGTVGGSLNYTFDVATGATATCPPLVVAFGQPVAASAVNTAIVVTFPAAGAGSAAQSVSAQGFQQ